MNRTARPSRQPRSAWRTVVGWSLILSSFIGATYYLSQRLGRLTDVPAIDHTTTAAQAGDIIAVDSVTSLTPATATVMSKENFGAAAPAITTSVTKVIFHYRTLNPSGTWVVVYGRAYIPESTNNQLKVFAFAPGTTGIGDQCAASLEVPTKANWANYDSHLVTYASQGMAVVTTDYEGMRDASRIHHYMIGELEGRALLDAVRALGQLPQAQGRVNLDDLFVGGYSQGGHAAFWADKIAAQYARDLKIKGVIGFGAVMSVKSTMADVVRGANINWFGPYVLYSYHDYYGTNYPLTEMLQPVPAERLNVDVPAHCINTNINHWGKNPAAVFTPELIKVFTDGVWEGTSYAELGRQLDLNAVGPVTTTSAKRLNIGALDNVVLATQQTTGGALLCTSSKGPVNQTIYPRATHYDTMVQSFRDTVAWMNVVSTGQAAANCPVKP